MGLGVSRTRNRSACSAAGSSQTHLGAHASSTGEEVQNGGRPQLGAGADPAATDKDSHLLYHYMSTVVTLSAHTLHKFGFKSCFCTTTSAELPLAWYTIVTLSSSFSSVLLPVAGKCCPLITFEGWVHLMAAVCSSETAKWLHTKAAEMGVVHSTVRGVLVSAVPE